jgi:hypothetical protein
LLALHSSAALVCNAFEYWRTGELEVIERALGLPASIMEMRFEAQFPTGLKGEPPNLDVALELENGSTWAIEYKFTEPFGGAKDPRKSLRAAYFPGDTTIWTQRGLRRCGEIAKKLRDGELRWRRLDAPQLLKHILGLHTCRRTFTLVYLWMDTNSAAGEEHRKELAAFTEELSGEVPFVSVSYQQFVGRLRALTGPRHGKYFEYMQDRYVGRPEGSSKAANRERN